VKHEKQNVKNKKNKIKNQPPSFALLCSPFFSSLFLLLINNINGWMDSTIKIPQNNHSLYLFFLERETSKNNTPPKSFSCFIIIKINKTMDK
jgi:hypothetical protein